MSDESKSPDDSPTPPNYSAVVLLLRDIGSTTWRMFVPTIGLAGLGYWADQTYQLTPWLFLLGFVIGCIITGLLIKQQLRGI